MNTTLHSRRARDAAVLAPAALGSAGMGLGAAYNPLVGVGLGAMTVLTILPWATLFAAFAFSALANKWGFVVSGNTLRAAQAVLVPYAARTWFLTQPNLRPRWRVAEWIPICWIALNVLVSKYESVLFKPSFLAAAILGIGVISYLAVYIGACTRERLIQMARIVLVATAIGAALGVFALVANLGTGSTLGIDLRYKAPIGGAPAVSGLAYEHDIFGSTCAFGAIAFLVLLWDGDGRPLFRKRRTTQLGFYACFLGMLVSQARGGWIGFAVTFVALLIFRRPRRHKPSKMMRNAMLLVLFAVLGAGVIWASGQNEASGVQSPIGSAGSAFTTSLGSQLSNVGNISTGSGAGRLRKWETAISETRARSFLLGLGTNSYGQRHFHPSHTTAPYLAPAYLESLYVRTFYDTGALGLLLLMTFLAIVLWPFGRIRTYAGDLGPVARAFVFAWFVLLVAFAITDAMLLVWPWVTLGLARAARTLADRQDRELRQVARALPQEADGLAIASSGNGGEIVPGGNGMGGNGSRRGRRFGPESGLGTLDPGAF
jgi:hypothetical protein